MEQFSTRTRLEFGERSTLLIPAIEEDPRRYLSAAVVNLVNRNSEKSNAVSGKPLVRSFTRRQESESRRRSLPRSYSSTLINQPLAKEGEEVDGFGCWCWGRSMR
ncbi:LOW QUALITY PROTEIN: hypothetical protein TorRG33x02_214680 [Trema orientale]|uniref:Uncharacterized protein n=1 Tax=Trema orientale TaxID=63057 RepID=A0A2P5EAW7_TREOI|nr:LOW QUALITY PROTEIN: hypothetical protein TorRG33x02_214680 [Trema orientale]